ncbi:MAG TPA: MarR family winged helix-turn-helix transcriptional regulator [Anaerolineae bacterium]|nr:MarR family winged helix-turn-helix transcriptional regulator [Anaerolineae bacterium]HQK13906.1 MarR family winged helix-turn-helix transcriptional regulator [Anaerolineae bacterium]
MSPTEGSESLDFLLAQVCKVHRARIHTLFEELGLYHGQPPLLFALWDQDGQTHRELAGRLHIRAATITKMVQRMEKAGFVECRTDPNDQRVSRVYLTDHGRNVRDDVNQVFQRLEDETFAGFTPEECALLRHFLVRMRDSLLRASATSQSPLPNP